MYHYVPMYLDELCGDISPMKQPFGPYLLWTESLSHQTPFSKDDTGCTSHRFTSDTSCARNLLTSDSFYILLHNCFHQKTVPDHKQKVTPEILTPQSFCNSSRLHRKSLYARSRLNQDAFTPVTRDLWHQTHFTQDFTANNFFTLKCLHQTTLHTAESQ